MILKSEIKDKMIWRKLFQSEYGIYQSKFSDILTLSPLKL